MFSKKDIIILILLVFIYCIYLKQNNKIEKMTNANTVNEQTITTLIKKIYKTDIEAIRNLADIADKLQGKGKYKNKEIVLPGNLTIQGNLKVNKNSTTVGSITGNGITGNSITGSSINGKSITGDKLNISGSAKVNSFEVQNDSRFGTSSNRRLQINSSNYRDGGTYISFHNGNSRLGYLMPRTSKNLDLVGMKIPNVLYKNTNYKIKTGCHQLIYTSRINSSNPWMSTKCGKRYAGFAKSGDSFQIS